MNAFRSSLGTRDATPDVPSKNALTRAKVFRCASSLLITMPRIMTDPANQFQTHFMSGIRPSFRLISYWKRLRADKA